MKLKNSNKRLMAYGVIFYFFIALFSISTAQYHLLWVVPVLSFSVVFSMYCWSQIGKSLKEIWPDEEGPWDDMDYYTSPRKPKRKKNAKATVEDSYCYGKKYSEKE